MTSPPDPALPRPKFCAKLHWAVSSTFTVQFYAKTPVLFRHVSQVKNTFNLDEDGKPMAVLVGFDGQEISPGAGEVLVEILDKAQKQMETLA